MRIIKHPFQKQIRECRSCGIVHFQMPGGCLVAMGKLKRFRYAWISTDKFNFCVLECLSCNICTIRKHKKNDFYCSGYQGVVTLKDKKMLGGVLPELREKILSCAKK